jgi:hypothetical protein
LATNRKTRIDQRRRWPQPSVRKETVGRQNTRGTQKRRRKDAEKTQKRRRKDKDCEIIVYGTRCCDCADILEIFQARMDVVSADRRWMDAVRLAHVFSFAAG